MARNYTVRGRITAEDAASPVIAKVEGRFKRFSKFLKSRLVISFSEVARAARTAFAAIEGSATLQGQTRALSIQLAQQGHDLESFLAKLKQVSGGTVSEAELISASARAVLLGIPAEEISTLLEIAAASAVAAGTSVGQAFEDIGVGIGRASPLILDNLGIVVKLGAAYGAMAADLGKTTEELTSGEQKQALLNAVIEAGTPRVQAFRNATSTLGSTLSKTNAALKDATTIGGDLAGRVFLGLVGVIGAVVQAYQEAASGALKFFRVVAELIESIPLLNLDLGNIIGTLSRWEKNTGAAAENTADFVERMLEGAFASRDMNAAQLAAAAAASAHSDAQQADNITIVEGTQAVLDYKAALDDETVAAERSTAQQILLAQARLHAAAAGGGGGGGGGGGRWRGGTIGNSLEFRQALSAGFSLQQAVAASIAGGGSIFVNRLNFGRGGSEFIDRPDLLTQYGEDP